MGQASASAASDVGINSTGNLTVNQPNYLAWAIGGVVAIVLLVIFGRRKRK